MPAIPEASRFSKLLNEMHDIYERKNSGYAGQDSFDPFANFRMSEKLGISAFKGCLVRMSDKFVRICNLTRDETNNKVNESITDTLIDLAVYSLIAICLFEETAELNVPIYKTDEQDIVGRAFKFHYSPEESQQKPEPLFKAATPNMQRAFLGESPIATSLAEVGKHLEKASKIYNEPQKEKNVKYPTSILGKTVRVVDGGTDLGTAEVVGTNSQRVLVKFENNPHILNVSWDSIVMED